MIAHHVEDNLLEEIRSGFNKGMAIGDDRFKNEIEIFTGMKIEAKESEASCWVA